MNFDQPAILGGKPTFDHSIPLVQPTLPPFDEDFKAQIAKLFTTGRLTKGRYLQEFEVRIAEYLGVKHAVAVSSCTLGLLLTYHGLGLKGEVIVPSFTFMATVHPLIWIGVKPVFVDIDPYTWDIDPVKVETLINENTSAIVAVHNFGNPAPIAELENIARKYQLKLVFDAAHGFGSLYQGRPVGSHGDAEVFSTSPTKLLVTGEGGVVATNWDDLAEHVRVGREYGNPGDYNSRFAGLNARMPEFNALLGLKSLEMLEENAKRRNQVATAFRERLGQIPGISFQFIRPGDRSSYKDFTILVDERDFGLSRDVLAKALRAENIDTRKYHDPPVHMHDAYRDLHDPHLGDSLSVTMEVASKSLTLPIWSHMEEETVEKICAAIKRLHHYAEAVREVVN